MKINAMPQSSFNLTQADFLNTRLKAAVSAHWHGFYAFRQTPGIFVTVFLVAITFAIFPALATAQIASYQAFSQLDLSFTGLSNSDGSVFSVIPDDLLVTDSGAIAITYSDAKAVTEEGTTEAWAEANANGLVLEALTMNSLASGNGWVSGPGDAYAKSDGFGGTFLRFQNDSNTAYTFDISTYYRMDVGALSDNSDGYSTAEGLVMIATSPDFYLNPFASDFEKQIAEQLDSVYSGLYPDDIVFPLAQSLAVNSPIGRGLLENRWDLTLTIEAGATLEVFALAGIRGSAIHAALPAEVPLPPAILFFGNGLLMLVGLAWRKKHVRMGSQ